MQQGAPLVDLLQPGLTEAEMDDRTRPLGVTLPDEARLWWGWHDGVAVEHYGNDPQREIAVKAAGSGGYPPDWGDPDYWWHPQWFPITESISGSTVACDCSVRPGEPTPIRAVSWGTKEDSDVPVARSFGEMVEWWLEAFDTGAWRYDRTQQTWVYSWELLAAGRRLKRVV